MLEKQERNLRQQIEVITQRETEIGNIANTHEKELAMLKHNFREIQRKSKNKSPRSGLKMNRTSGKRS
jgi:hypothetical protein